MVHTSSIDVLLCFSSTQYKIKCDKQRLVAFRIDINAGSDGKHHQQHMLRAVTPHYSCSVSPLQMASYVQFETRCYEIAKGSELFTHLADSGIASYDDIYRVLRAPGRELTNSEIFGCACDIFLTDYPTQKQILWLRLLIVESKEIVEHWGFLEEDRRASSSRGSPSPIAVRLRSARDEPAGEGRSASSWGRPPPLTTRPKSVPKQQRKTRVEQILESLREWSQLQISITELSGHILNAPWKSDLFQLLHESVVVLVGAPNAGKSTLASNLAKALSLTKTRTTSKLFWLSVTDSPPYMIYRHYCGDSIYKDDRTFQWEKFSQSFSVVSRQDDFQHSLTMFEGHRMADFDDIKDYVTSKLYLTSSETMLRDRKAQPDSIAKHKEWLAPMLQNSSSYINDEMTALLPADSSPVFLVCKLLEKLVLDDQKLPSSHLRAARPDAVSLL